MQAGYPTNYDNQAGGFTNDYPNSPSSPSSTKTTKQGGGKSGSKYQSLVPLTIKQLLVASQQSPDETLFRVDGKEVGQVTFVGCITGVSAQSTINMSLSVDDGTGKVDVKYWLNDNANAIGLPDPSSEWKKSQWSVGQYIRVIGNLRSFNDKKSVVAYRIVPIVDFNEITHHFLEVIYVHLQNTRGTPMQISSTNTIHVGHSNYNQPFLNPMQPTGFMNDLHSQIIGTLRSSTSPTGENVHALAAQLNRSVEEIKTAAEFLISEGHLYSTIDEDHYRATPYKG